MMRLTLFPFAAAAAAVVLAAAVALAFRLEDSMSLKARAATVSAPASPEMCGNWTGEFLLIYDMSGSFDDDLAELRVLAPNLFNELAAVFPGSKFALSSFIDKPTEPFGWDDNYCYQTEVPMTTNLNTIFNRLALMNATGGNDFAESQLDALYLGLKSPAVNWSTGDKDKHGNPILRVVILATDAPYHKAGDAEAFFGPRPDDSVADCSELDYASEEQVKKAFGDRKARPLFLTTAGEARTEFGKLLKKIGGAGSIQKLSADSSNLVSVISKGLGEITCEVLGLPVPGKTPKDPTAPKPSPKPTPKPGTATVAPKNVIDVNERLVQVSKQRTSAPLPVPGAPTTTARPPTATATDSTTQTATAAAGGAAEEGGSSKLVTLTATAGVAALAMGGGGFAYTQLAGGSGTAEMQAEFEEQTIEAEGDKDQQSQIEKDFFE